MSIEEWKREKCWGTGAMIDALAVEKFGSDIVLT
jgi:hypothetical protein